MLEVDLTYDRERELNVRLNANTGEWDTDILANMFDIDDAIYVANKYDNEYKKYLNMLQNKGYFYEMRNEIPNSLKNTEMGDYLK